MVNINKHTNKMHNITYIATPMITHYYFSEHMHH